MWWDEATISSTVNRKFILANLDEDDHGNVDKPLRFGGGLTNDTYGEWIVSKVPKLFLILVDCGVEDQIFGVIDDSWDDDDLPLEKEQVDRLKLTERRDEKFEQKFYEKQFLYLLRNLQKGEHLEYAPEEYVPLDCIDRKPLLQGQALSIHERVILPGNDNTVMLRKRIPLGTERGQTSREDYLTMLEQFKATEHKHVVSLWASYIHHDVGYMILDPVHDATLRAVIAAFPAPIKVMEKQERRELFLQWLHCLADALALLHSHGLSHGALRPSNIGLCSNNDLVIASSGQLTGQDAPRGFDKEAYDFAPPEHCERPASSSARGLAMRPVTTSRPTVSATRNGPSAATFNDMSSIHSSSTSSDHSLSSSLARVDSQLSDVFSLGCIFLELLTQLLKRTSKNFTAHRAAKNKTPGRGGGLPDSSYHKNLSQVESWIKTLAKDASKKDDKIFLGIKPILALIERMISPEAFLRPTSSEVCSQLASILSDKCGLKSLCCNTNSLSQAVTPGIPALLDINTLPRTNDAYISPVTSFFPRGHFRTNSGNSTINSLETVRESKSAVSTPTTPSFGSDSLNGGSTITGDGRAIAERRYASGGGRTAKPRPRQVKTKPQPEQQQQWQPSVYAVQDVDVKGDVKSRKRMDIGIGIAMGGSEADFDEGSLYELRLHDYENGGEVRKVGWETL